MSLQSTLVQIARHTDNAAARVIVADGNIHVTYSRGLEAYLEECAVAALINSGRSKEMRSDYLRSVLPDVARRLAPDQMLLFSDVSGADLGLALCVMGIDPFRVEKSDDVIWMDAIDRKTRYINLLSAAYTMAEQKTRQMTVLPDTAVAQDNAQWAAQMPLEFLVMIARMLSDVGFNADLIARVADSLNAGVHPPWAPTNMYEIGVGPATTMDRAVKSGMIATVGEEMFYAQFVGTQGVLRLLRAVIAVLYARRHTKDKATLDALPEPRRWAIHRQSRESMGRDMSLFYFSVVVRRSSASRSATVEEIEPLLTALYHATGIYPRTVPVDAAEMTDSSLTLRLHAFLGAGIPLLDRPKDPPATPLLWRQRRAFDKGLPLNRWFVADAASFESPQGQTGPYVFFHSVPQVTAMETQAHIDARLAANPNCRKCGDRIDVQKSLFCSAHSACSLGEE